MKFFPGAYAIEVARMHSRADLIAELGRYGFRLLNDRSIRQSYAGSLVEYGEKIGLQGLSSLREYCALHDTGEPVTENLDLFLFYPASSGAADSSQS